MNWKTALPALVTLAVALAGCGGDECTQATDYLASCAPPNSAASSSSGMMMAAACSGFTLCQSQCINKATCAQINGNAPAYTECLTACQGK